jgi:hypothetical protein
MTSQLFIIEKMSTHLNERIHIMPGCVVHFHGHRNKMVPVMVMKLSILVDFSNDAKFRNPTCWLTNDIQRHHLPRWVNNYYIGNEDLVFLDHVEIGLC